jgi:hypothetical protein
MKLSLPHILLSYLLTFSPLVLSNDNTIACIAGLTDYLDIELVEMIEKQSMFNAKKIAENLILQKCKLESLAGNQDISIGTRGIRFSQFSFTYDSNDKFFYCKNKAGHEAYLSSLAQKLTLFSRERERIKREEQYGAPEPRRRKYIRPVSTKETTWDCINPFYYFTPKVEKLNKSEMEVFESAHPGSCTKSSD